MRQTAVLWVACLALLACSCGFFAPECGTRHPPRNSGVIITEGAWGEVWFWQGDFMPVCPTGTIRPVVREVLFYELTVLDSVVQAGSGGFYTQVNSKLVATTQSNARGFFELRLAPGTYSVFVREEDTLLYSNRFDGQGRIFPVVIKKGEATGVHIDITYASAS
jgi:hypothetical protein